MLAKRIVTFFGGNVDDSELINLSRDELSNILHFVFEEYYYGEGKWSKILIAELLTRIIRKRPRDLIKICNCAGKKAGDNKVNRIGTNELQPILDYYSTSRLDDTFLEYKSELPEIKVLLQNMKPTARKKNEIGKNIFVYTKDQLHKKVQDIMSNKKFFFNRGDKKKEATFKELEFFMYKINFLIGIKKGDNGKRLDIYFEEHRYLMDEYADYGFKWLIHPAFHWALNPGNNLHDSFDIGEQD